VLRKCYDVIVSDHYTEREARTIRTFVRERKRRRQAELARRLEAARQDVECYRPVRIYQWGSLLEDQHLSELSDIDLGVDGVRDPSLLSELRAQAEQLTEFPVDIAAMEHIHPAYAEHIRRRGRIVYER
jgi:predicted nucleotidyltransferase